MAESNTEIANMAISHLGVGKPIANLDEDNTEESRSCRTFFTVALKATLRDFGWPFATRYVELSLVGENPNSEYAYSYRYPADCASALKILSGIRNEDKDSEIHYMVTSDDTGKLIYTDQDDACLKYTAKIENPTLFDADFELAFSYRLAALVCPRVTRGDVRKTKRDMMELYNFELLTARANALNEQTYEPEPTTESIKARE